MVGLKGKGRMNIPTTAVAPETSSTVLDTVEVPLGRDGFTRLLTPVCR